MFNPTFRKLTGAALATAVTLSGVAGALLAASAQPAMAECKYGGPNCVHNGYPKLPTPKGQAWPSDPTADADCQQYSSCGFGIGGNWGDPAVRRSPSGGKPVRYGFVPSAHTVAMKRR
jgi:hypothetical protein